MTRTALIERGKDGTFGVYTPDIDSLIIGEGRTVAEAKFVYKYDLASIFNYYSSINVTQFAKFIGLNPSLLRQYKMGNTYISERQAAKIEAGLHRLGRELMEVQLIP